MSRDHDALLTGDRLGYVLPDGRTLFSELTLGFGRERTGLVGPNGIGKSTLLRVLAGQLPPSHGTVVQRGRVAYLPQRRGGADPDGAAPRTVADVLGVAEALAARGRVLAGGTDPADHDAAAGAWNLADRVGAELARFGLGGVALDRPVASLSGGEATRVSLAARLLERPDLLIVDEPTNDLDAQGRASLYRFVEAWTGGLLVVTHDRALLARVDRILELTSLGLRAYGGNYDAYRAQRDAEEAAAERELDSARTELRRTRAAAVAARERQERRMSRGRKSAATANLPKVLLGTRKNRSEGTARRVLATGERMVGEARSRVDAARLRVEERERMALDLPPSGLPAGKRVVDADGLRYAHPGAAAPVLDGVRLSIVGPERVAVTGPNGAGKTTLLRLLAGELSPAAGTLRVGIHPARIACLDQHAARLRPDASVLDNLRQADPALDLTAARWTLARYLFRDDAALARVDTLSGGERLRAALACALQAREPPQLLLLDEPTNHLDLDGLRAVEDVLARYDGAMVVVSHDPAFLRAVAVDRSLALPGGGGERTFD